MESLAGWKEPEFRQESLRESQPVQMEVVRLGLPNPSPIPSVLVMYWSSIAPAPARSALRTITSFWHRPDQENQLAVYPDAGIVNPCAGVAELADALDSKSPQDQGLTWTLLD